MAKKPHIASRSEQQLKKAEEKFDKFSSDLKELSTSEKPNVPVQQTEPQTKLSNREANSTEAPYIKPNRAIFSKEKFDEKNRAARDEDWKYVRCIVENNEIIGESIQFWLKKWPGEPAHEWTVPVNKPVQIPKFVAEHLSSRSYVRYVMQQNENLTEGNMTHSMIAKEVRHRLDCRGVGTSFIKI